MGWLSVRLLNCLSDLADVTGLEAEEIMEGEEADMVVDAYHYQSAVIERNQSAQNAVVNARREAKRQHDRDKKSRSKKKQKGASKKKKR